MKTRFLALLAAVLLAAAVPVSLDAAPAARHVAAAEVAFTYGLAAFRHGEDGEAERLFREAVEADPEHGGARYWLGLVLLGKGDGEGAAAMIAASLDAGVPPPVERARVVADLARARELAAGRGGGGEEPGLAAPPGYRGEAISLLRLPRWEARLGLAAGSDSNPALVPEEALAVLPGTEPFTGSEGDPVVNLDLRFETHPFYGRRGWSLGLGVEGRQAFYDQLDALDFRRLRGFVQLAWGSDPLGYLVGPLGFTRVPVGHRPVALLLQGAFTDDAFDGGSFLGTLDLALALTLRESRATATQIDLRYSDESYDEAVPSPVPLGFAEEASGEVTSLGLSQYVYFAGRNGYLRLGLRGGRRDAGTAYDADLTEATAELSVPVGRRLFVYLAGSRRERDFDHLESNPLFPSFFADRPRQDTRDRWTAAASWAAGRRFWVTGRVSFIDQRSEVGSAASLVDLDWNRTVFTLGVRWFFEGKGGGR
jgi:hypothetical protein